MSLPELSDKDCMWYILKGYDITITPYGDREWWLDGKRHRTDGPAREYVNGTCIWYLNGKHHREDGPAMEFADGTKEWFLNGKYMTEEEYRIRLHL